MPYSNTETKKYLDAAGLAYFSGKLNNYPTNDVIEAVVDGVQDALDEKLDADLKGAPNGVAELGADGKIVPAQLPASTNTTYTITQDSNDRHAFTLAGTDGSSTTITIPDNDTTYTFDGTYNATSNKAATVSTVTQAINALDGTITGVPEAGKTLTQFTQTDGRVSASFEDISITKSQVSDFPTLGTAAAKNVTDNVTPTEISETDSNLITARTLYNAGYTKNEGTVTGITMNGTSMGTSGVVNLGTVITDISSKQDRIIANDTATWRAEPTFTPALGQIIIYTDKGTYEQNGHTVTVPGIKIGDGVAYGVDLPFLGDLEAQAILSQLNLHVNDTDIHITSEERTKWNNKLNYSLTGENLTFNRN